MEQTMNAAAKPHALVLEGRARARVSGVTAVCCFNEQEIASDIYRCQFRERKYKYC